MRMFIGVELPDPVKAALGDRIELLQSRLQRVAPRAVVRWVEPANLHVTIWFLGELRDERVEAVSEIVGRSYRTPAFRLLFGTVGAFPSLNRPRVIWTGIAAGGEGLSALYEEVRQRLEPAGFQAERREYSAHLTLARVKDLARFDGRRVREALTVPVSPLEPFQVSSLTLFRSRLSPRGAQYESLLRVPLP